MTLKKTKVPKDQIRTKADKQAITEGCWYDEEAGLRAVRFIETFVIPVQGRLAQKEFRLFAWQRDIIMRLFSWKRKDGTRRFRKGWISLARQNGKSFLCSAICLYMLMADGEQSPTVASAACSRKQASLIFDNMMYAIDRNEKLKLSTHVIPSKSTIKVPKTNGKYESLSVEARSSLGSSYSCVILDEFAFHASGKLAAALEPTLAARTSPMILAITTAGTNFTGPGYDWYLYAKKIQDGLSLDTSFFSAIYEADEGCQVTDEGQWHKANPSLAEGSLSLEELRDQAKQAEHSKAKETEFRYFRLNRWTKGLTAYLSVDKWDACKGLMPTFPPNTPIYLGADFANSKDLTAITGVIPYEGKYYILAHAWAPRAAAEIREKENATRYGIFESEGSMTITDGNGTDFREIRRYIRELGQKFEIKEIICDPNYANETLMELMEDGFTVYRFAQSPRNYTDPTKRLEALVLDKKLINDGNNLMRWQMQNLQVEVSGEDMLRPSKGKSSDKIDNVCALIMALSRVGVGEQLYKVAESVYETTGLFFV